LGAVASAFNRVKDAEKYLNQAIRRPFTAETANEAREILALLHIRLGRSSDAGHLIDEILKMAPQRSDVQNMRVVFGAFSDRPNMSVRSRRANFRCDVTGSGVYIPVSINGTPVTWLLDTGANVTVLSEAEARMVGLVPQDSSEKLSDLAGGTTKVRTALVGRMTIGATEMRNVPVIVLPDSEPPWNELPPGKRGLVSLPIARALQTIKWTRSGTCQTGPGVNPSTNNRSNLAFDQLNPLIQVESEGRQLDFILDAGNQHGTQLWQRFAQDFPLLVQRGTKGTKRITQVGGSNEREVIVLPELRLRAGGFEAVLRPANTFSKPVGNDAYHGNLGMDLLSQATDVTIDFQSMVITLR
jgi:Aspartyl protease